MGKGSIHSITDKSLNHDPDDQASLTEREVQKEKTTMELKRRSQVVPQYSAGQVGNNNNIPTDDVLNPKQYGGDSKQLDDVEVSIGFPKKSNKQ